MNQEYEQPRLLMVITDAEASLAVYQLFHRFHIPLQYQFRGQGTASSEILSLCGLGETAKVLSISMIPPTASARRGRSATAPTVGIFPALWPSCPRSLD